MNMKMILPMVAMAAMPLTGAAQNKSGLRMQNLNKTVRPADDFYEFATGGWQKNNPLPAAYSRFGSFDQLQEDNNKRINTILGELQKKTYKRETTEQKLSDFYKQALDVERRNKEGIAPVKPLLDEIEAATTKEALKAIQLKYPYMGLGESFGSGFAADEKNVKMNILNIGQGGLTLGQKDYYVNNDEATVQIREAFKQYLVKMFRRSEEHTSELQSRQYLVCRLLLEKKYETRAASIGKPTESGEMQVIDADCNHFPHGESSEIALLGHYVT